MKTNWRTGAPRNRGWFNASTIGDKFALRFWSGSSWSRHCYPADAEPIKVRARSTSGRISVRSVQWRELTVRGAA